MTLNSPSAITKFDDLIERDYGDGVDEDRVVLRASGGDRVAPPHCVPLVSDTRPVATLFGLTPESMISSYGDDVTVFFSCYRITTSPRVILADLAREIRLRIDNFGDANGKSDLRLLEQKIVRLPSKSATPLSKPRDIPVIWLIAT